MCYAERVFGVASSLADAQTKHGEDTNEHQICSSSRACVSSTIFLHVCMSSSLLPPARRCLALA